MTALLSPCSSEIALRHVHVPDPSLFSLPLLPSFNRCFLGKRPLPHCNFDSYNNNDSIPWKIVSWIALLEAAALILASQRMLGTRVASVYIQRLKVSIRPVNIGRRRSFLAASAVEWRLELVRKAPILELQTHSSLSPYLSWLDISFYSSNPRELASPFFVYSFSSGFHQCYAYYPGGRR